jgi:Na+/proline symporter
VVRGAIPAPVRNDEAMPAFLLNAVPVALAGVVFAGVAAAIMSTVNAFLSVGAAALTRDLPQAFGRNADGESAQELGRGRAATLILAVSAAAIAHAPGAQVAFLGIFGYGLFASTLVPALAIGLNWPGATPRAAVASIVTGLTITLTGESASHFGLYTLPSGVPWSGVALVASTLVLIALSVMGRATEAAPAAAPIP